MLYEPKHLEGFNSVNCLGAIVRNGTRRGEIRTMTLVSCRTPHSNTSVYLLDSETYQAAFEFEELFEHEILKKEVLCIDNLK